MARAISVKDLRNQIVKICPQGTQIPSLHWNLSSLQYTGILPLKYMIHIQQLHMNHIESHYALLLDDKHRCKIGDPVAAIERGKQVVVTTNETFAVADMTLPNVA